MPLTTLLPSPVKHFAIAVTFCLSTSLISTVVADENFKLTVKAKGTLSSIVHQYYVDADVSRDQIMIAIVAANPDAFRGGNIHFMKGGKNLRLPTEAAIQQISEESARELLTIHNDFFRRGKTGDMIPPTFVSIDNTAHIESLIREKEQQDQKLSTLEVERAKLREQVTRLEKEKEKRDGDLQTLEARIQDFNPPTHSISSVTTDLKMKLSNGELIGEGAALLENLQDKNESLNAQLQSARSNMAESTRMEIALERRMLDVQKENTLLADALKATGVSPNEIKAQLEQDTQPIQETMNDVNTASVNSTPSQNKNTQPSSTLKWLILPILGLVFVLALLWKLFSARTKKKTRQRVQQPANVDAFADYNPAANTTSEMEQEPPLEASIKMDVAHAYIEAGAYHDARQMFNEVLDEGNAQQVAEAQKFLSQLPQ